MVDKPVLINSSDVPTITRSLSLGVAGPLWVDSVIFLARLASLDPHR